MSNVPKETFRAGSRLHLSHADRRAGQMIRETSIAPFQSAKPFRICVCTSNEAATEPRAPRHAAALAQFGDAVEIVFIDASPIGSERKPVGDVVNCPNISWKTHFYPTRFDAPVRLFIRRAIQVAARMLFAMVRTVRAEAISARVIGLERTLTDANAQLYFAHEIDTLLPAYRAALRNRAALVFDSMEFHSDMGTGQSNLERSLIEAVESKCLPACVFVTASSVQVSDALAVKYGIPKPLPLYNMPVLHQHLASPSITPLRLYWRNAVIGLGTRGLDEALVAMTLLPAEITLHLQGKLPESSALTVRRRIDELGVTDRVVFHPPHEPGDAVRAAANHSIGLCLERREGKNHDLTVSNKIFDYHMAGLAVIASDLPALRAVIERSKGGLLFAPGSASDLATQILSLHRDPEERSRLSRNAREFAVREGNREKEMTKLRSVFADTILVRPPDARTALIGSGNIEGR